MYIYIGYTQKNGAVLKVNKKFISHLSRAQRTPQWQLSKFLMRYQQFASHAYCGAAGPVFKMASHQKNAFCVLHFEVSRSVITVQREFCARFRTAGSACTTSSSTQQSFKFIFVVMYPNGKIYNTLRNYEFSAAIILPSNNICIDQNTQYIST
jgi:hypothetical protein